MQETTQSFKDFIDNRVKATTKFNSADDLLENSKPFRFVLKCFGVVVLIVLLNSLRRFSLSYFKPELLLIIAIFGYASTYITGRIKCIKLMSKSYPAAAEVDLGELTSFLKENLQQLSPHFSEFEYSEEDKTIRCKVKSKKVYTLITFSTAKDGSNIFRLSARKCNVFYYIMISKDGFSASNTNAGFGEYRSLYLGAPILSAAVEYYLKSV